MSSNYSFNNININELKNLKIEDIQNSELRNFINIFSATNGTLNRNQNKNLKSLFNTLKEFAGADEVLSNEELDNFLRSNESLSNYDSENVMNLLSNARNASIISPSQEQIHTLNIRAFGNQTVSFRLENGNTVEITEIFDENYKKTKEIRRISSVPATIETIYFNEEGAKTRTERIIDSEPPKNETDTYEYTEDGGVIISTNTDSGEIYIQRENSEGKIIQKQKIHT